MTTRMRLPVAEGRAETRVEKRAREMANSRDSDAAEERPPYCVPHHSMWGFVFRCFKEETSDSKRSTR